MSIKNRLRKKDPGRGLGLLLFVRWVWFCIHSHFEKVQSAQYRLARPILHIGLEESKHGRWAPFICGKRKEIRRSYNDSTVYRRHMRFDPSRPVVDENKKTDTHAGICFYGTPKGDGLHFRHYGSARSSPRRRCSSAPHRLLQVLFAIINKKTRYRMVSSLSVFGRRF